MATKKGPKLSAFNQLKTIEAKFKRLQAIQQELNKVKALYQEYDALMEELMEVAIEVQPDKIIIHRDVTIGKATHRVSPHFFDEKKGKLLAKMWKSTPFPSFTLE